jgi:thymidine kinase
MHQMAVPTLEVITGPMFSGKSAELLRRIDLFRVAEIGVVVFKPVTDTRSGSACKSRNGDKVAAIDLSDPKDIFDHVNDSHAVVAIDEAHFFPVGLGKILMQLVRMGKHVIVACLDLDFSENAFPTTAVLLCLAQDIKKLPAACITCKSLYASRSQRLVASTEVELVGDKDYEARCLKCFVPPES